MKLNAWWFGGHPPGLWDPTVTRAPRPAEEETEDENGGPALAWPSLRSPTLGQAPLG